VPPKFNAILRGAIKRSSRLLFHRRPQRTARLSCVLISRFNIKPFLKGYSKGRGARWEAS